MKKSYRHFLKSKALKFEFIRVHRCEFRLEKMCTVLGVSRAGYYHYTRRKVSRRAIENKELLRDIKSIYSEFRRAYGVLRITKELKARGKSFNKKRIQRIMRVNGIRAKASRKFKVTTNSKHTRNNIPDLVQRKFHAEEVNTLWTSDITHIHTREGWLYLCVILDVCSRGIVGWSMLNRITEDLVMSALIQAVRQRRPKPGLIFHSDRGSQYDSLKVKGYLKRHFFRQSMSRKGSCYDNAITESFFHSLKTELVHSEKYETRMEAMISLFDYIEIFYNRKRRHSALGYKTPEEFELMKRKICLN